MLPLWVLSLSSPLTGVYISRDFVLHAASLRQGFPHCAKFLTAASRRSLDRVSVPVWLIILSDQLKIVDLVGRYPTNYLILHRPILKWPKPILVGIHPNSLRGINPNFSKLSPSSGQVVYALLTRPPLYILPKEL